MQSRRPYQERGALNSAGGESCQIIIKNIVYKRLINWFLAVKNELEATRK
jgi:hypothetical protein